MKKILIVDDDRDVFESMKIVLEAEGYGVSWATNGTDALMMARSSHPDLVILDVMMNSDDEGFQVSYAMRQEKDLSCIPIVMVTSVASRTGFSFDPSKDGEFLPVNRFLEKPVDPRVLVDTVRENLGH
jgi:DNA-binding response OmpR family regulator